MDIAGIPYKGGAPVITALLAGEIDVTKIGMGNIAGQLNSGKLKILAIQGTQRSRLVPSVPTLQEAGLGAFPLRVWWGFFMPAGSPDGALKRINAEIVQALSRAEDGRTTSRASSSRWRSERRSSSRPSRAAERERAAQVVKDFHIPRQ